MREQVEDQPRKYFPDSRDFTTVPYLSDDARRTIRETQKPFRRPAQRRAIEIYLTWIATGIKPAKLIRRYGLGRRTITEILHDKGPRLICEYRKHLGFKAEFFNCGVGRLRSDAMREWDEIEAMSKKRKR